jgi:hypothetical protein
MEALKILNKKRLYVDTQIPEMQSNVNSSIFILMFLHFPHFLRDIRIKINEYLLVL